MNPDRSQRCPGAGRSPPSRISDAGGLSQRALYVDDDTLHKMIEAFGPLEYSQFTATYPGGSLSQLGDFQDPFGSPVNWQGEEIPQETGRRGRSPSYMMPSSLQSEGDGQDSSLGEAQRETIIQWFDRAVEKELEKRREPVEQTSTIVDPAISPLKNKHALNLSKGAMERMAEASASRVEISARLETDFTNELTHAVEQLAKAETMCSYAEALEAAEAAAQNAPPELMEQAAAAGARSVNAHIQEVRDLIPGVKPIEVIGYVGITKPRYPKTS